MRLFACTILLGTLTVALTITAPALSAENLSDIAAAEAVALAGGMNFTEGPVWHKDGYVLFSDIPANKIMRWDASQGLSVWRENSNGSNGLTFDCEGRLIACEHGARRVSRTEADGSIEVIADKYKGKRLNSPNDCCVRSDGMIFFTDPSYGVRPEEKELSFQGVFAVKPGSEPILLADDFNMPNGIAFSPDESLIYICDSGRQGNRVRVFNVEKDGTLKNGKILIDNIGSPDGMKVDAKGNLYFASNEGLAIFNPTGNKIGVIKAAEQPANCAFGGPDNKTLFITARKGFYAVRLKIAGQPVWK
ncbi:MAG: SMP-30/gluconolactonase/LRE family protein [Candidatus Omnitrophota bacterium]